MIIFPFRSSIYRTKLTQEEILGNLERRMEPKQFIRFTGFFGDEINLPYEGSIEQNTFKINPIGNNKSSFFSIINGEIGKDFKGAFIKMNTRPSHYMLLFILISFSYLVYTITMVLLTYLGLTSGIYHSYFSNFMAIFFLIYIISRYISVSNQSIKHLSQLFEAEIENRNLVKRDSYKT